MKTIEGNKLIGEFMGWRVYDNGRGVLWYGHRDMFDHGEDGYNCSVEELDKLFNDGELDAWFIHQDVIEYHSSWNDLMPVVEKIEKTGTNVTIGNGECEITTWIRGFSRTGVFELKIDAVWHTVIEYIQWYNEQNKET